jgi:translocation and assembly module TamB
VQVRLTELGLWGLLAPPGWRVSGAMNADISLAGTVQAPELRGTLEGSGLQVRSVLDGIDLHEGTLRATLSGQQLQIDELVLQGGTGSRAYISGISGNRTQPPSARGRMTVTGTVDWSGVADAPPGQTGISMDLSASLARMQALVRNDRQLTLSGELSADLQQGALRVRGDLRVDRGTILLPDAGAPTLGDDVVVVRDADDAAALEERNARGQLQTALPLDLEVRLDLGRDLAVQGLGLSTRLEGELTVRSSSSNTDAFDVFGEVRTDDGRYRAWGQAMDIESGVVRFNGPYLNPSLNLLAIRPEIEVRAGVRVTGTLTAPVVRLYSDPSLPESEILSWVVLGRPTVISGAEGSSMQQAALGLLAGRLASGFADDIGVDELGLNESAFSIGKRISNELYVTYEAGLSGAASVLYVFYDITRRLTLRAQTGEASALDLIYTINYD